MDVYTCVHRYYQTQTEKTITHNLSYKSKKFLEIKKCQNVRNRYIQKVIIVFKTFLNLSVLLPKQLNSIKMCYLQTKKLSQFE